MKQITNVLAHTGENSDIFSWEAIVDEYGILRVYCNNHSVLVVHTDREAHFYADELNELGMKIVVVKKEHTYVMDFPGIRNE